jgi:gas vesicle protein
MEKSANKTGKIVGALLLGAAVGGAIGATLGLLFAPEKGIDMRKKLKATGDDLAGAVKGKFNEFVEMVKIERGNVKGQTSGFVENGVIAKADWVVQK